MQNHTRYVAPVLCLGILLALSSCVSTSRTIPAETLQSKLEELVAGLKGNAGVYVRHLPSGRTAAVNADSLFPTASMVKVPILINTFDAIERGELDYRQELVYRDSLLYAGVDILGSFEDGEKLELSKVIMLMTVMSDNTASLWLQHLSGTGTAINDWLSSHGFEHTRVNSRTAGRSENRERYGWGQTTPKEMAELLVMIRQGEAVSPSASERMYRHLSGPYWTENALSQIPPWVQAAAKNGAVNQSRSEVVLVNAPHGDYVFCVITKDQHDQRWEDDNEGNVFIREVSRAIWEEFE
jgi:beta-lactamase class A